MSKGEKATLHIDPEWAYGRNGKPEAGILGYAKLVFEASQLLRSMPTVSAVLTKLSSLSCVL
jgi:hypothetical protein